MRYCLGPPDDHTNMWAALGFMPFGLFFDFMDGKVARWRGKSSLMGQELDSLADLVYLPLPSLPFHPYNFNFMLYIYTIKHAKEMCYYHYIDILRRRPRRLRLRPRSPHPPRHSPPLLLRPLRPHPPRPLQRNRRRPPKRRDRQIEIFRGNTHPHESGDRDCNGALFVVRYGGGGREGRCGGGVGRGGGGGGASGCGRVCGVGVCDG